jgi:vacuolar iron transporter family protein
MSSEKATPDINHTHSDFTGGWLRPAVFGVMDGLVSNSALLAGIAGAGVARETVLLAGFAGLAAGAFSMAAGEYVSVRSQSEAIAAEVESERWEILNNPAEEERELALMYEARGLDPELARQVAAQLSVDPEHALDVHVREELGVDKDALPSASIAAVSSFVAFGVGAVVPLIPYILGAATYLPAAILTAASLFGAGALVSRLTPKSWWYSGFRQLFFGALAAGVTYLVGMGAGGLLAA